jgi:phosphate transport system substrate-binding protein
MTILRRGMLLIPIVVLLVSANLLMAQDNTLSVAGSSIVLPIVQEVAKSATNLTLTANANGTADGFTQFCAAQVEAVASSRAINETENQACATVGVAYAEILVAQNILTFIGNPQDTFNTCLSSENINSIFEPSAVGTVINWTSIVPENPDLALTVFAPQTNSLDSFALDNVINGAGIRSDAILQSNTEIIGNVANTPGAIGVVPYQVALAASGQVTLLAINTPENGCVSASPENFENDFYPFGDSYYLYVNRTATAKAQALLDLLANPTTATTITTLGYTAPTIAGYTTNAEVIAGTENRGFSEAEATFVIPQGLSGQLSIGGRSSLVDFISPITELFAQTQQSLQVTLRFDGEIAGLRRFCNGELDAVVAQSALSGDTLTNCTANNITTYDIPMGTRTVVLVGNSTDTVPACLTREQVRTLWQSSDPLVTNWSALGEGFPDLAITTFAPSASNDFVDNLLRGDASAPLAARTDSNYSLDPLYNAAATANVQGAITYMSIQEYESVVANNQQNVELVAIDNGNGCILPFEGSIADGSYPFVERATLIINNRALGNINTQAIVWSLFEDNNYNNYTRSGFAGLEQAQLPDLRRTLVEQFASASQALLAASAEATGEATAEMTAEATMETTVEATAEMTAEATMETTVEATAEMTPEATMETTVEATAEATAEMTPEATAEMTAEPTAVPTTVPTARPTARPTIRPSAIPTSETTPEATAEATASS